MPVDPRWYESFFETEEWLLMATTIDEFRVQIVAGKRQSPGPVRMA